MIINLRGTNGSGKSTIVKAVMEKFDMHPSWRVGRRQPIGYFSIDIDKPKLWVVGHYETECGGCDTIPVMDDVYDQIIKAKKEGYNVLYEGIMASGEYRRCADLHKETHDVMVIALDVLLADCITSILERRERTHRTTKPFNAERTTRRQREVRSMMEHLKVAGVPVYWRTREEALRICLKELGAV